MLIIEKLEEHKGVEGIGLYVPKEERKMKMMMTKRDDFSQSSESENNRHIWANYFDHI